jgi:hypothetical protein
MSERIAAASVAHLISHPPKLHQVHGELSSQWKLQDADLIYLDEVIQPGMRTLETGAGLSTVVFALKGARHTCIVPDEGLIHRIKSFCSDSGIPHSGIEFILDGSEHALPRLPGQDYDFALIDGRHGFPAPFIDCYYIARLLKIGGCVMIDDLHIWTTELLVRYLRSEKSWRLVHETWHAATFMKQDDNALAAEWTQQPFVVRRSLRKSFSAKLGLLQRMLHTRDLAPLRLILESLIGKDRRSR